LVKFGLPILLFVTAVAYGGLRHAGFVWDDIPLIVQNQALSEASIWSIFTSDLWAASGAGEIESGYYRPLVLLSFALDRWLFDLEPLGYHVHSLFWHLCAMVGLFRLVRPLVGQGAGLLAVGMFGLHPVQSEVVAWVAARNDAMAACFGFMALSMVWCGGRPRWHRSALALLLTVFAALSKETALLLPLLLGVADWTRGYRAGVWMRQLPIVSGVLLVLAVRGWISVGSATVPTVDGWWLLVAALPNLVGGYVASVFSPWPVSSARDLAWIGEQPPWRLVLGWGAILVGAVAVWTAEPSRRRAALLGCAWAVLLIGITLVPTADKGGYGDRFLYWPMAGVSIAMAALLQDRWRGVLAIVAISSAVIVSVRLPDWSDDRKLWGAAVRDVPTATNEVSLGHALTLHARHKRAHVNFVSALAKPGIDTEACGPVVGSAMRTGLPALAFRMGSWAVERGCAPTGKMNGWMATAAALEGRWSEAEQWANGAEADPRLRDVVVRAAIAKRKGDHDAYQSIADGWLDSEELAVQVDALLRR
jgi:hypothetical protein